MYSSNSIEPLESRIAPAGLIDIDYNEITGELRITGDFENNIFHIDKVGKNSHWISGDFGLLGSIAPTELSTGGNALLIGKLTKLTLELGGGNDEVLLNSLSLSSLDIEGTSLIRAHNLTVKGTSTFQLWGGRVELGGEFSRLGPVMLDGSPRVNEFQGGTSLRFLANTNVVNGSIVVDQDGFSGFINRGEWSSVTVTQGILLDGGGAPGFINFAGSAPVTIGKSPTGHSIDFSAASDSESRVTITGTKVALAGFVEVQGGAGGMRLELGSARGVTTVGKLSDGTSIKFAGGSGADNLLLAGQNVTLAGGISFQGGEEKSTLTASPLGKLSIGKLLATGNSLEFTGGSLRDNVTLAGESIKLAGGIDFEGGLEEDTLAVGGGTILLGVNRDGSSIDYAGGGAFDTIALSGGNVSVGGLIEAIGGGSPFSAINLGITNLGLFKSKSIRLENTSDGGGTLFIKPGRLLLDGDLIAESNAGQPIHLDVQTDGQIKRDVRVEAGAGGTEVFLRGRSGLPGSLKISGGFETTGLDGINSAHAVILTDVQIGKDAVIDVRGGGSIISLDNFSIKGAFTLKATDATDSVTIERYHYAGVSVIGKNAVIELGGGNDTLDLGDGAFPSTAPHKMVRFLGTTTIDGGTGDDLISPNFTGANFFAQTPTVSGFENP